MNTSRRERTLQPRQPSRRSFVLVWQCNHLKIFASSDAFGYCDLIVALTLPGNRQLRRGSCRAGLNGGLRLIATRRRPSSIHPGIKLSSAPAAMRKFAATFGLARQFVLADAEQK